MEPTGPRRLPGGRFLGKFIFFHRGKGGSPVFAGGARRFAACAAKRRAPLVPSILFVGNAMFCLAKSGDKLTQPLGQKYSERVELREHPPIRNLWCDGV